MGASLVPAVMQEFVALAQSSTDAIGVQISFDHPGEELAEEAIWIGETVDWTQEWGHVGNGQLKESFGLAVRFFAGAAGQDSIESTLRVFELFELCQDIVRDQDNFMDLRAGTTQQLTMIQLVPDTRTPYVGANGRIADIHAVLKCSGRI